MPFYANACRVKNQRICMNKKKQPLVLYNGSYDGSGLRLTADNVPGGPAVGFIIGPPYLSSPVGSLVPSGTALTDVEMAYTIPPPIPPATLPPQQLILRVTGTPPTTLIVTGGDLHQSYTFKTNQAHHQGVNVWSWFYNGFVFTPGHTYTLFLY